MVCRDGLTSKVAAAVALAMVAEVVIDGGGLGAVVGGLAFAWLAVTVTMRRALLRVPAARIASVAAALYALIMVDDPSPLAWALFWAALSLAAVLPRHGFDDALAWSRRLAWHALTGIASPLRDAARAAMVRDRRGSRAAGLRAVAAMLAIPLGGGATFVALFASANPLIGRAFAQIALPDPWTIAWRSLLAAFVVTSVWPSLRPAARATAQALRPDRAITSKPAVGVASLALSLVTFNAIFGVENVLDLVFLWSGAALPAGVTMADYAHRGAYSLIGTALLAGVFVLVALRPGSAGAASRAVRMLVALWIAQNLLLVASSGLRTLDYVDAYGMTVLRLSALAWMALVGSGLALIAWRLFAGRSAAWLINANALAAALVLTLASVVDLGATAAAWNARVALAKGKAGPRLDLCYMARLGPSALVSLARIERAATDPTARDRLGWLRRKAQDDLAASQAAWRSWTPRGARRLGEVEVLVGTGRPRLRAAPLGRDCDGSINVPLPPPSVPAVPVVLTQGPER